MNPSLWRKAFLEGVQAAEELLEDLQANGSLVLDGSRPIDVFKIIVDAGIVLLFKPLPDALGYCLKEPIPGILVSSFENEVYPRSSIQRLTAAHELGHLRMGHLGSIDYDIDASGRLNRSGPSYLTENEQALEVAAEAFAGRFLIPKRLLIEVLKRQGWRRTEIVDPFNIYQLSLRLGASYSATCWALFNLDINNRKVTDDLTSMAPKELKREVLGKIAPKSSQANAWLVREQDSSCVLTPELDDTIVVALRENVGAGYRWDVSALETAGLEIIADENFEVDGNSDIGGANLRRVALQLPHALDVKISLREIRPWIGVEDSDREFNLVIESLPQQFGFSNYEKSKTLMAA